MEVVKLANPELTLTVPSVVPPSLKTTDPVGELPLTVAVRVTAVPTLAEVGEAVRLTELLILLTVTDTLLEVAVRLLLSPA